MRCSLRRTRGKAGELPRWDSRKCYLPRWVHQSLEFSLRLWKFRNTIWPVSQEQTPPEGTYSWQQISKETGVQGQDDSECTRVASAPSPAGSRAGCKLPWGTLELEQAALSHIKGCDEISTGPRWKNKHYIINVFNWFNLRAIFYSAVMSFLQLRQVLYEFTSLGYRDGLLAKQMFRKWRAVFCSNVTLIY